MSIQPSTKSWYHRCVSGFLGRFDWDIAAITPERCVEYATELLKAGYKPSGADQMFKAIRQFFKWRELSTGVESPFRKIRGGLFRYNYRHTLSKAMTEQELQHFLKAYGEDTMVGYLVLLGFRTGLRLSDCCLLRWENIDFEQGLIQVVCHKTRHRDSVATIPICLDPTRPEHDIAALLLRRRGMFDRREPSGVYEWDWMGQHWVYPRCAGTYMARPGYLNVTVRRALAKTGLKNRTHHSARHGFASTLVNSGVNTHTAKSILGITSDQTLAHYVKPDVKFYREALSHAYDAARRRESGIIQPVRALIAA